LIKGSKDSDLSLVSNKNFSEIIWSSGWALGPATWAKMTPKLLHLMTSLTKNLHPQPTIFFECNLKDWPIRLPFEPLSSSLAQSAEDLGRW